MEPFDAVCLAKLRNFILFNSVTLVKLQIKLNIFATLIQKIQNTLRSAKELGQSFSLIIFNV